ncbi:Trk system potassium uptake protein TrkH [Zhongshania aliphaticivorans]|uniref:Trk system potassium uptake protein n=1 Tax=Zhongshania aliphaticivorans TaxID=1470434 RepID=A0A5S9PKV2_9GAMM|nr:TrkH family potassium uptake protein [Zhongshania aliphaticivorans]CAA0104526.1 Trk system potassium uptake protein TrkH [Zhongshania aliphaticivorans]CAA0104776.1 Trk system potassium uptake protein TrkH [Zhongshania aliphaticivorans]
MHLRIIGRIIGVLLMIFSLTMAVPAVISAWLNDGALNAFVTAFALTFSGGLLFWLANVNQRHELSIRDGFLIVSLFWTVLGLFGALPFYLADNPGLSVSDAVFESISGLTTTGATVITGLDELPISILFYRQFLQWLGGIGIIVIAVAILPILGIGGMQLYRAEIPGPVKDNKLTPRITGTAKILFLMYVALTLVCTLAYWLAGMSFFDAITHSFSTVAIGGFSTHDASMGYFQSPLILMICSGFMLFAALSFTIHFHVWRSRSIFYYLKDSETSFYLIIVAIATLTISIYLYFSGTYALQDSIIHGVFHTISVVTTAGFGAEDFSIWPSFLPVAVIMLSFIGGCAGSTGGGMKVVRVMLIAKQGIREMKQLIHPNAVIPLKIGSHRVEAKIVSAVWSFVGIYMISFIMITLAMMACGLDALSAFSATAAAINNMGPGLGEVAASYRSVSDAGKWILCYAMLLGRLEIFTLLVLFLPSFWRR